ncbi:helix-turn-helix domain-containing protein [Flavivirga eckloniae]|uniref:AraC family transcriptional regulator n=1 Tax=Flavivirga eckloniae TaxID=1803846 RepID=A0A2K9PUK2_9FLAO|nr:helix-turn-helix domain-containing protein [Flavivirga eckloniae]AUP80746.1 AraC family transcriptional regulator [Flavivirga eckloniae]
MKKGTTNIEQYHLHKDHPEKLQFEVYNLSDYLETSGVHAQLPHSHSFYQILWIYNEGGVHYIDLDSYDVKTNTIFFISKNQIHYFDKTANHEGVLIHFNESFLMQSDVDIFLKYNVFNNQGRPCYCITRDIIDQANSYLNLIKKEKAIATGFGHQQVIRYLLKSLLIVLERTHLQNTDENIHLTNAYELQYLQFRELIEHHYNKNYMVSDYADLLHISTKTLATITKTVTSKSPATLITERIILEAQRLLAFTSLKVNEIAYKLGFEDASYFVKYFKRHLKTSPTQYRRLILNGIQ